MSKMKFALITGVSIVFLSILRIKYYHYFVEYYRHINKLKVRYV